jgi:hypothetical protein
MDGYVSRLGRLFVRTMLHACTTLLYTRRSRRHPHILFLLSCACATNVVTSSVLHTLYWGCPNDLPRLSVKPRTGTLHFWWRIRVLGLRIAYSFVIPTNNESDTKRCGERPRGDAQVWEWMEVGWVLMGKGSTRWAPPGRRGSPVDSRKRYSHNPKHNTSRQQEEATSIRSR